jgi:hypothetical protein
LKVDVRLTAETPVPANRSGSSEPLRFLIRERKAELKAFGEGELRRA